MPPRKDRFLFDEKMKLQAKIPLNKFTDNNKRIKDAKVVVLDGSINNKIVRTAESSNVGLLVGHEAKKKFKTD